MEEGVGAVWLGRVKGTADAEGCLHRGEGNATVL